MTYHLFGLVGKGCGIVPSYYGILDRAGYFGILYSFPFEWLSLSSMLLFRSYLLLVRSIVVPIHSFRV